MSEELSPAAPCPVCGGRERSFEPVLWHELAEAWGLSADERRDIDRQQGERCLGCGANLRSMALAAALREVLGTQHWLAECAAGPERPGLRILEVNEAGSLSSLLARWPQRRLVRFPEVDLAALPFDSGCFDLVVHSDTLEHVPDPVRALRECHRVLAAGGACCFTVPVVAGRLTRSRRGLAASWHGEPERCAPDQLVHTEYGADVWRQPLEAGFERLSVHSVEFPCALAWTCWR